MPGLISRSGSTRSSRRPCGGSRVPATEAKWRVSLMSQPADDHGFDRLKTLLAERGFTIERSEYHRKNFGSWLIVVASRPRILIVWDGKEPWLLIQQEVAADTAPVFQPSSWSEVWIERKGPYESPDENCLNRVVSIVGELVKRGGGGAGHPKRRGKRQGRRLRRQRSGLCKAG